MKTYDIAKGLLIPIFRSLWRIRGRGIENVPRTGPLIVACNHLSYLDPPALGVICPRRLSYMAKAELFRIPVLGAVIRSVGAYPVDRAGSASGAIKRSVAVLRAGGAVGIFPEGTRNLTGAAQVREGVALLASLARAPVVPACVSGSDRAGSLHRISVSFGKPLYLPRDRKATREDLRTFTERIMSEIRVLAETADA
ncbi:MAG: lysophospholipid acyltransferase family protein [Vulcanimicrobiaceae bacterium]